MSMRHPHIGAVAVTVATVLTLTACGGGEAASDGSDDPSPGSSQAADTGTEATDTGTVSGDGLQMMIASSGDAETSAVEAAVDTWSADSGIDVQVIVAQDIQQQLGQSLAGGDPPDVFYVDAARFGDYAATGALYPYVSELAAAGDFYPSLVDTFTFDGEPVCAPKDFSTLALVINNAMWEDAGLTDDDIPTTWDELATVAETLTADGHAGLGVGPTRDRLAAFMVQNGGWFLNDDGTQATVDSPENAEALEYVAGLLENESMQYPAQLDAGWGGEALGIGRAAMTIEGNWIKGAIENDYPDLDYTVVELPEGPAGKGTLLFTQCWGIAAASPNQDAAVDLVDHLTSVDAQLAFADAFGVMPSRMEAEADYVEAYPEDAPFVAGAEYGHGPVSAPGFDRVLADFDSQLAQLSTTPPEQILQGVQTNAEAALAK